MGEAPVGASSEDGRAARLELMQARALGPLIDLIAESFLGSLPADVAAKLCAWLRTPAGREAFRSSWPNIIEGYFEALRQLERSVGQ
jgi:hypothetical protein